MQNTKPIITDKGVTLIEVVISIVIFSVLMMGGLTYFFLAHKFSTQAKQELIAIQLCKSRLELMQNLRWNTLQYGISPAPYPGYPSGFGLTENVTGPDGGTYRLYHQITFDVDGSNMYAIVYVQASWDSQPIFKTYNFTTIISSPVVN